MFGCYNCYTDVFSHLFLISFVVYLISNKNKCDRLDLQFRWTSKVWVNHKYVSWLTTHLCVNHIYSCFLENRQVCKPRHCQLTNNQKVEQKWINKVTTSNLSLHFVPVYVLPYVISFVLIVDLFGFHFYQSSLYFLS